MSTTNEYPITTMASKPMRKGESVLSPTSATDPRNMGGQPEKWDVTKIFSESMPPPRPADSSVADLGERAYDGKGEGK